jgi:hypothetical protein
MRRRAFLSAALIALAAPAAFAQTQSAAPRPALPVIEPQNALERALLAATEPGAGEPERDAFRRLFLRSEVALALSANAPDAPPAQIEPRPGFARASSSPVARASRKSWARTRRASW